MKLRYLVLIGIILSGLVGAFVGILGIERPYGLVISFIMGFIIMFALWIWKGEDLK